MSIQVPSDMYRNLNKTADLEENKVQVNMIKSNLVNLIEKFKSKPTSDTKTIRNINNMVKILELNLFLSLISKIKKDKA